jgi:tetratricopeptide (TPR) repeat protein
MFLARSKAIVFKEEIFMLSLRSVSTLFLCLFVVSFCFAQEHSDYHVFGTVKDSKGTPVAGAKIVLKNKENGKEIAMKSGADGTFDQQFVPHAIYALTVTKEGYKPRAVETVDMSPVAEQTIQRKIDIVLVTEAEEEQRKMQEQQVQMDKEVKDQYKKGTDLFSQKKYDEAIAVMQEVSKKSPDSYGPYLVLAASYQSKGDCDNAIPNYLKAISIKKDIPDSHKYLADCYVLKKDYAKAVDSYKSYLELNSSDVESRCVLANILLATDKTEEAGAEVTKGMQDNPSVGICYKVNGEYLLKKGDMAGATRDFKKYLEIVPDAPDKAKVQEMIDALEQSH